MKLTTFVAGAAAIAGAASIAAPASSAQIFETYQYTNGDDNAAVFVRNNTATPWADVTISGSYCCSTTDYGPLAPNTNTPMFSIGDNENEVYGADGTVTVTIAYVGGGGEVDYLTDHLYDIDEPVGYQVGGDYTDPVPAYVVPEPATWALMILGFGALGGALRARRKTALAA